MDLSAARSAFIQEARELIADMEAALLASEADGATPERLNAIFRAAHTIKGSAGLFALDLIVSFTHVMESVLERMRSGELALDAPKISILLRGGDYLNQLIDAVEAGTETADPSPDTRAALVAQLHETLNSPTPRNEVVVSASPEPHTEVSVERDDTGAGVSNENWHLSLRFGPDLLRMGMDPLSFIQYLQGMGRIVFLHTVTDALPSARDFDPECCYLGFEIDLLADVDKAQLESVFDFVREESRIRILPPHSRISEYIALIEATPPTCQRLGEILVAGGTLTQAELAEGLQLQAQATGPGEPPARLGEILIDEHIVQPQVVAAALSKQKRVEEQRNQEKRIIKVDVAKLDQLINLVGELVISNAGARLLADRSKQIALRSALSEATSLVEQIRDRALSLRMIAIGEVFQRFPRVVRDVSQELGKQIELVVTGADAELDKSMVDKLSDPLMHIVRNAVDHGIEPVEKRRAAGKSDTGRLHLHAYHESGCIVIEVSDDGRGLDAAKIRAKAIERGLIPADATLSDDDLYQLIFAPGFSTAEQVTNLSGRGVGMDVVKRGIEQLRGEIQISTRPGEGTTFRISLPLTLAIIDGFQVGVGNAIFVIPLDMVVECSQMSAATGGQRIINLRGELLPYVRLREVFDLGDATIKRESLVVVSYGAQRIGLVVDRLLGEFQAVIKPLGHVLQGVHGISGSTILGDGSVALILDIPTLIALGTQQASLNFEATQSLTSFNRFTGEDS